MEQEFEKSHKIQGDCKAVTQQQKILQTDANLDGFAYIMYNFYQQVMISIDSVEKKKKSIKKINRGTKLKTKSGLQKVSQSQMRQHQSQTPDQIQIKNGNVIFVPANTSEFKSEQFFVLDSQIKQNTLRQPDLTESVKHEDVIKKTKETKYKKKSSKGNLKDLNVRIFHLLSTLFKKMRCKQKFDQVKTSLKLQDNYVNLTELGMIYQHPLIRSMIAKGIFTGAFRREILMSRKNQKNNNLQKGFFSNYNFQVFSFIQGGSNNRQTLNNPLGSPWIKGRHGEEQPSSRNIQQ